MKYTLLADAICFAAEQHRDQKRTEQGGSADYLVHPLRVTEHLRRIAGITDVEILCASVLHDTIEDSGTRHDELAEKFGSRVAGIVAELTNDSRLPKEERHEDMIRRMATASPEAKLIKLADRLDNLQSVSSSDPAKLRRILQETPRLLEAMRGSCRVMEQAVEEALRGVSRGSTP